MDEDINIPSQEEIEREESLYKDKAGIINDGFRLSHEFSSDIKDFQPVSIFVEEEKLKEIQKIKQVTIPKNKGKKDLF